MFVIGTSIGHCGTRWLATLLHRPEEGVVFWHEKLQKMFGTWKRPSRLERRLGLGHGAFDPYFTGVARQLKDHRVVGDIGSWQARSIPAAAQRIEIDRIIYLVRNGIPQIQSRSHSYRKQGLFDVFARLQWQDFGKPFFDDWSQMTSWQKWCLEWWASIENISWLKDAMPHVPQQVYRFEDLVGDVEVLADLVQSMGLPRRKLRKWQRRDINRHLKGDRSPRAIWRKWSAEQREVFQAFCGGNMGKMGYEVP